MGTTWGDLRYWEDLDLWWVPNAIQGTATATTSATASAPSGTISGATAGLVAIESFASAARIAVAHSGNVVECTATATAAIVTENLTSDAAATVDAGASATAIRIPPADRPAGALIGRIRTR